MKKKILALTLVICLAVVAVAGITLAYFTDTDKADNVFTIGKVDIKLIENFDKDNAKLKPGKENAITKEVSIELQAGSENAWVWYEWLIPAALDSTDGSTGSNNVLHVNSLGRTWDTYRENSKYWAEGQTEALPLEKTWDHDPDVELAELVGPQGFIGTEEIGGIIYNKYVVLYHGELTQEDNTTTVAMSKAYLDPKVDYNGADYTINGNVINYNFNNGIHIYVRAYAIQSAGIDNVYAGYVAYNAQVAEANANN